MAVPQPGAAAAGGATDQLASILSRLATTRTDISAGSDLLLMIEDGGEFTEIVLDPDVNDVTEQPWTPPEDEDA